jgi:hypothetical protein
MELSIDQVAETVPSGLLLGGLRIAIVLGLMISLGLLDLVNMALPSFILGRAYIAHAVNIAFGLDPITAGLITSPLTLPASVLIYLSLIRTNWQRFGTQPGIPHRGCAGHPGSVDLGVRRRILSGARGLLGCGSDDRPDVGAGAGTGALRSGDRPCHDGSTVCCLSFFGLFGALPHKAASADGSLRR